MNREPINPDDPEMTAYALGELSMAEAAEFEARLVASPKARRELASMKAVMSLLREGLSEEWRCECEHPPLTLVEPAAAAAPAPTVVRVSFARARRAVAAAAAVAATLVVGAVALSTMKHGSAPTSLASAPTAPPVRLGVETLHVPQLFLAEEVEDISSLDLVGGNAEGLAGPVDASYLEADAIIPASFQPTPAGTRGLSERVDSYLPPLGGHSLPRSPATGMIERRLGREAHAASHSPSVLVSGYVTMGGRGEGAPRFLGGFQPVSISGNPVVNEESDLRLLADLNGLKKELSELIEEMPKDARERADLVRILERSERVVAQLKSEISH